MNTSTNSQGTSNEPEPLLFEPSDYAYRVAFAETDGVTATLEGQQKHSKGDAIVTGGLGERWPVPIESFNVRYLPIKGTEPGTAGFYRKKSGVVSRARQLLKAESFAQPGGRGELKGAKGDWVIMHPDGGAWPVARKLFELYYWLVQVPPARSGACTESIPVYFSVAGDLTPARGRRVEARLSSGLTHTAIRFVEAPGPEPLWFTLTDDLPDDDLIPDVLSFSVCPRDIESSVQQLLTDIKRYREFESVWRFTYRKLKRALGIGGHSHDEDTNPLAWQLAAVDRLNQRIAEGLKEEKNSKSHFPTPLSGDSVETKSMIKIGAVADIDAGRNQDRWQQFLLDTTSRIAGDPDPAKPKTPAYHLFFPRLLGLSIAAALFMAMYTELSGGCKADDLLAFVGCAEPWWEASGGFVFFGTYSVFLLAAWWKFADAKTNRWEETHQDYRLLAECIRVQAIWASAGIRDCVTRALPIVAHSESGWVRNAMREVGYRYAGCGASTSPVVSPQWDEIHVHFLTDQIRYHRKTLIERRKRALIRVTAWAKRGFLAFLLMVPLLAAHEVLELLHKQWHVLSNGAVQLSVILTIAALLWAATLRLYWQRLSSSMRWVVPLVLLASIVAALLIYAPALSERLKDVELISPMMHHFIIITGLGGLVFWGALKRALENYGWEAEVQRGEVVLSELLKAERVIGKSATGGAEATEAEKLAALEKVGHIFVEDQAVWHKLHRDKRVEAASGGG
jgi:hypothetical protein